MFAAANRKLKFIHEMIRPKKVSKIYTKILKANE